MKRLLLLLLCASLAGADIDTKLYEGSDREAYYQQVREQIDAAQAKGTLAKALADDERAALEMLRQASQKPAPVERDPEALLPQNLLNTHDVYRAVQAAAGILTAQEAIDRKQRDIQSKLTYLKQKIDRITADEKPLLLSYQLQFAYYKLQQQNLDTKAGQFKAYGKEVMSALKKRFGSLQCLDAPMRLRTQIAKTDTETESALQQKVAADIATEHGELEGSGAIETLRQNRSSAEQHYNDLADKRLSLQTQLALCMLRTRQDKAFFALLDTITQSAGRLPKERRAVYEKQDTVLRTMAKEYAGMTSLVLGDTLHETRAFFERIGGTLSAPLFVFNERAISLLSILKALLILIAGFTIGIFYKRWIAHLSRRWPDMSQMSIRLASNIGYYLIVFVALLISVSSLGIDMTSLSLIAGALSIGVGFGLQTVVSNLIAGIILMFERTIRIGDTIEISDVLRGRVTDMRIRSTTIKTFDNIDIVVPNSSFIQNNVINWTLDDVTRRVHIPFSVAYGTEVEAVKRAVLDELAASKLHYINYDPEKMPEVWMVGMGNSSVDFELIVWVEWANRLRPNALRSDFLILIYNALYKNGIQIPFPQLDLHVKQLPKTES